MCGINSANWVFVSALYLLFRWPEIETVDSVAPHSIVFFSKHDGRDVFLPIFRRSLAWLDTNRLAMIILILVKGLTNGRFLLRTIRASVFSRKQKEYVDAARVMGN